MAESSIATTSMDVAPVPLRAIGLPRRIALAILDQGFFAGTTFLTNVLAARWLVDGGYGVFAIAYALLLFAGALFNALICEPAMVFGPGNHSAVMRSYARALLRWQWMLSLPTAAVFVLGSAALRNWDQTAYAAALLGVGLAFPGVMLLWSLRSIAYAARESDAVPLGSSTYLGMQMATLVGLHLHGSFRFYRLAGAVAYARAQALCA
jgi:hypothetical protein